MALPYEDDDDRLAQLESLGEQWIVNDRAIYAIPQEDYVTEDLGGHGVEASMPMILVRLIDIPDVEVDSRAVQVETGYEYTVALPPQPDGTGMAHLMLNGV